MKKVLENCTLNRDEFSALPFIEKVKVMMVAVFVAFSLAFIFFSGESSDKAPTVQKAKVEVVKFEKPRHEQTESIQPGAH